MNRSLLFLAVLACKPAAEGDDTDSNVTSDCGAPYEPFDPANYENQQLRVDAYEQIVAIRKSDTFAAADFTEIETLYATAELNAKVAGRTDDHSYASVVDIGAELDQDIQDAITAGKADTDIAVQGQIIDKTLQRFFFLSVYHEGMKAADDATAAADVQAGWDEGFGYFGLSNDGSTAKGIANTLAKRDETFGTSLVDTGFNALVDGRCALVDDDRDAALESLATLDEAILTGFALSVIHEMNEYSEDPLIKGWEGQLYWNAVADWIESQDATAASTVQAEFDKGVESVDAATVKSTLEGVLGL